MVSILRKNGWTLNPNDKVVNTILKRCENNDGLCPCVHNSEDYEGNAPITSLKMRANVGCMY